MSGPSLTCSLQTSKGSPSAISSQGSADGLSPSSSQAGPVTDPSGPAVAHASLSASQAKARGLLTSATFGLLSNGSSHSADLQLFLESRLRARMGVNGSPEYVLTWRRWSMPSGPPICALRGARIISGKDFSGWPTPNTNGWRSDGEMRMLRDRGMGAQEYVNLSHRASISRRQRWWGKGGLPKPTGQENPRLLGFIMGYPPEWCECAATATPSSRRSPRSSSLPAKKPSLTPTDSPDGFWE